MKRWTLKRIRFVEFLVIGVFIGVIEDVLAILFATDAVITPRVLIIVFIVAIPFAFFSEIVVDHPRFWQIFMKSEKKDNTH